jgi:3-oxoacyl-[acyl-carrier protein] reductase
MSRDHKVLLVTGASSDIGMHFIHSIAADYEVIWTHYCSSATRAEQLADRYGDKIKPMQADFSKEEDIENMIRVIKDSQYFPDHIVHLSAPRAVNKNFHTTHWEEFDTNLNSTLRPIVMLLESMIPYMAKQRYGKIILMLSSCLIGIPPRCQSTYVTIKYALYGLMKSLSAEYADKGICVNAVSPDMIETRFVEDVFHLIREQNAEKSPLKRNLTVEDVIPAFQYLLSDDTVAVTGTNMEITGGIR